MMVTTYIIICIFILLLLLCVLEYIMKKQKQNLNIQEGQCRYFKLEEHRVGKKKVIHTDSNYQFYTCVKGSELENQFIEFNIDRRGFIEPSEIYEKAEINIVFVGDSTTECALVNPEIRYPYLVGRMLEEETGRTVNSYNAGMSSATSFFILISVMCKVLPLKPDMIVWCSNISDLIILLHNKNWIEVSKNIYENFYLESDLTKNLVCRIKSAIRILFPNLYTWLYSRKSGRRKIYEIKKKIRNYQISPKEEKRIVDQVLVNLKLFLEICKLYEVIPIVSTQASIWKEGGQMGERELKIYQEIVEVRTGISYQSFVQLFEKVNQSIRELCRQNKVLLVDLEREIPKDVKYIYDYVHYTNEGSKLAAKCVFTELKDVLNSAKE